MPDLRYGENPHQKASWEQNPRLGFKQHQGKELSWTNFADLLAAARIVLEFERYASAVVKHTNPSGVATGESALQAFIRARDVDSLAAFGGVVGFNTTLGEDAAKELVSTFIECIIAPGVNEKALSILGAKSGLRVVTVNFEELFRSLEHEPDVIQTPFGRFTQARDMVAEARNPWPYKGGPTVVTKRHPTDEEWEALRFAWRVCAHVKSNAVIFTSTNQTLAIGCGQMSRIDSVDVAVMKAAKRAVSLQGSVAASDAFFPFRDGLDAVAAAGATAVAQPGGSVKDAEVITAADEHDMAMVFTGRRHFRH